MVAARSGRMLLWGCNDRAGHLVLTQGKQAAEMPLVPGCHLTRCFLHLFADLDESCDRYASITVGFGA